MQTAENFSIEQHRAIEDIAFEIHSIFTSEPDYATCIQKITEAVKRLQKHFSNEQIADATGILIAYSLIRYGLGVLDSLYFSSMPAKSDA